MFMYICTLYLTTPTVTKFLGLQFSFFIIFTLIKIINKL